MNIHVVSAYGRDGRNAAINTSGWVEDDNLGFSAMLSFHDPAMAVSTELFGTQILFGPQADLGQASFTSALLLRNITNQPVNFTARFISDQHGVPLSTMLPLPALDAQEVRKIDLTDLQRHGLIPQELRTGAVQIDYAGNRGDVMGRVFSISSDGSLGLYTALESFGAIGGSGVYWTADGNWNSILTVTNFSDHADTMHLMLTHETGNFTLAPIPLAPLQSANVSLKDVVSGAVKSVDGQPWPAGITSGGYLLTGGDVRSKLVAKEQAVSWQQKLATPYYATAIYETACLTPNALSLVVG